MDEIKNMNLSSGIISAGSQANKTGDVLELFLQRLLQDNGYVEFWKGTQKYPSNFLKIAKQPR